MSEYYVSVDAGNGGTNAVLRNPNGSIKTVYFPSVRASATGDSLGLGKDWELQYQWVDWGGHRYVVGDDVIRITRRHLERHHGAQRYGDEFHQFLAAVAVGQLGIKSGTVDLTLFAPPGMYAQAQATARKRFLAHNGQVVIRFKGDKEARHFAYDNVTLYPEGIGAAACFLLDGDGRPVDSDVLSGEIVILDMGVYTLDALKLMDGNFNPESLEHATWDNGGLNVHIHQPILRALKKQTDDFINLTVDDIDYVIRQGLKKQGYVLRAAGLEVDIKPLVDKFSERYAGWIANNIIDGVFGGFRGIKAVILVGGGQPLAKKWFKKWYKDKVLDRKQYENARKIHPVDMNAVGGLRLALARQHQRG